MLEEYALRFYTLLEQSIRLDAEQWLELSAAVTTPHMDDGNRRQLIESYQQAIYDIIEDVRATSVPDNPEKIKKELEG